MCYTLPKIWMGRIQKYWDKIMPAGYPVSTSKFSLKFADEEVKSAVDKFENELGTEESVVTGLIPEGTYVDKYIGVYDVEGTPGVLTLLSPEQVDDTKNITVLHYKKESDSWELVKDFQIIDNYVWGTLESFSPIAIVSCRKEIHLESTLPNLAKCKSAVICEGNTVQICEKEDGSIVVKNMNTGLEIPLTTSSYIVGGSADGSPIDKTNITVMELSSSDLLARIIAGSHYNPGASDQESYTTVNEVNFVSCGKLTGPVTGSSGAVRTNKVNITLNGSKTKWIGVGEGYAGINKDHPSFASRGWVKEANLILKDAEITYLYMGQNNEYFYVNSTNLTIDGGIYEYITTGGSNADTKEACIDAKNAKIGIFQSTNRGNVTSSIAKFTNCVVDNLFIGGDATDNTVTGTTEKIRIDINAGTDDNYHIVTGVENGAPITAEDALRIVDAVKISRNANVSYDDKIESILGEKLIIK